MIGVPGEDYELANNREMRVGDVVIVERLKFDYKAGFPIDSDYYRAVIGQHDTVSGPQFHMTNEPDFEFPAFAPWQGSPYASGDGNHRIWRRKSEGLQNE